MIAREATARGWLIGFFVLGPATFAIFFLQQMLGFFPAPAHCPHSITLKVSDAELLADARKISQDCVLIFTSSEGGAVGGGKSISELVHQENTTVVSDTEGYSPFRAIVYLGRMNPSWGRELPYPRMILMINSHYARDHEYGSDLFMQYFPEKESANFYKGQAPFPLSQSVGENRSFFTVLAIYRGWMRRRIGLPLERILAGEKTFAKEADLSMDSKWNVSTSISQKIEPESLRKERTIPNAHGLFESALSHLPRERVKLIVMPLHTVVYGNLGLSPMENERNMTSAFTRSGLPYRIVRELDQPGYWFDTIHFNERGRKALAQILAEESTQMMRTKPR